MRRRAARAWLVQRRSLDSMLETGGTRDAAQVAFFLVLSFPALLLLVLWAFSALLGTTACARGSLTPSERCLVRDARLVASRAGVSRPRAKHPGEQGTGKRPAERWISNPRRISLLTMGRFPPPRRPQHEEPDDHEHAPDRVPAGVEGRARGATGGREGADPRPRCAGCQAPPDAENGRG